MKPKYRALPTMLLLAGIFLTAVFYSTPARSQTTDELEKGIANLPPDQRAYERFRFWVTLLPPDQQRNPNLTMLVDSGRRYSELKGVQLVGTADLLTDEASVLALADSMSGRYGTIGGDARSSAPKRVAVKINVNKVISWDHGKLGGVY